MKKLRIVKNGLNRFYIEKKTLFWWERMAKWTGPSWYSSLDDAKAEIEKAEAIEKTTVVWEKECQ
jgi:hypothetical protein